MVTVARASIILVVVLGGLLSIQNCKLSDLQARLALESLPDGPGWTPAQPAPPKIEKIPRGNVIATVEGAVKYRPLKETTIEFKVGDCDLEEIEADLHCRVEVVEGAGRLQTWGTLTGFGQTRHLRRSWAGTLEEQSAPGVVEGEANGDDTPVVISAPPEVYVAPRPRPLLWEARLGYVLPEGAIRVGATRMFTRHLGAYVDATAPFQQNRDFDVSAGVAIRF